MTWVEALGFGVVISGLLLILFAVAFLATH